MENNKQKIQKEIFDENKFFEKVSINKLDSRAGKYNVESDKYWIISFEEQFRGLKRKKISENEDVENSGKVFPNPPIQSNESLYPFFLYHQEIFGIGLEISNRLFKQGINIPSDYYYDYKSKSFNSFLFHQKNDFDNSYKIQVNDQNIKVSLKPTVGVINSYDISYNYGIYLLINIEFSEYSSFLTLAKYEIDEEIIHNLTNVKEIIKREFIINQIIEIITPKIKTDLEKYFEFYKKLRGEDTSEEYFSPIMVDLISTNKSIPRLSVDEVALKKLNKQINQTVDFIRTKNTIDKKITWDYFLLYLMINQKFRKNEFLKYNTLEEIFQQKNIYKKFKNLFSKFLTDSKAFDDYSNGELKEMNDLKYIISNKQIDYNSKTKISVY